MPFVSSSGSKGGGSSASLVNVGGFDNVVFADATTSVPCDGSEHAIACLVASPPEWMDSAGHIILPGLYIVYGSLTRVTPPTTPGLFASWSSPGFGSAIASLDILDDGLVPGDTLSLVSGDLPTSVTARLYAPTDVTGVIGVQPIVSRLASST